MDQVPEVRGLEQVSGGDPLHLRAGGDRGRDGGAAGQHPRHSAPAPALIINTFLVPLLPYIVRVIIFVICIRKYYKYCCSFNKY